jgi:hypothetical protein
MSQFDAVHILTVADELAAARRTKYDSRVETQVFKKGRTINRLFQPSKGELCQGDTHEVQSITGRTDSARGSRSTLSDMGAARNMNSAKVVLRHTPATPGTNDFTRFSVACEISDHDLERSSNAPESAVSIMEKVEEYAFDNLDFTRAFMLHADADGKWADQNGAQRNPDGNDYATATTYTPGATAAWVAVDGGSIAAFEDNTYWDFYTNDTLLADEVVVRDRDIAGSAILVELTAASTVSNLNALTNNAAIYRAGEKGNGYRGSLKEWFATPPSGDSFLGGIDRRSTEHAYMKILGIRRNAAPAKFKESHLDELALAMQYQEETEDQAKVVVAALDLVQSLRRDIANGAQRLEQATSVGEYMFGSNALSYIHPHFGKIAIAGDPMAPPGEAKFLTAESWTIIPAVKRDFSWTPPNQGGGPWFRKSGTLPNGGKQLIWRKEGYGIDTVYCYKPRVNGGIFNLTA